MWMGEAWTARRTESGDCGGQRRGGACEKATQEVEARGLKDCLEAQDEEGEAFSPASSTQRRGQCRAENNLVWVVLIWRWDTVHGAEGGSGVEKRWRLGFCQWY